MGKHEEATVTLSDSAPRPSEVVPVRVERARRNQGISQQRLAERCAELGARHLTRDVIVNIERGRRAVDVDDVWALGAALNIPPNLLMLPLGDSQRVAVTPTIQIHPQRALEWAEGAAPLLESDGSARVRPWPEEDTPDWVAAASPLYLYHELHGLQRALRDTQTDAEREGVLQQMREHVEVTMRRAGVDERELLAKYEED